MKSLRKTSRLPMRRNAGPRRAVVVYSVDSVPAYDRHSMKPPGRT